MTVFDPADVPTGDPRWITDPEHLDKVVQSIVRNVIFLTNAWVDEDAAACAPRASGGGRSSNVAADPTQAIADAPSRHRHRDHIASTLLHVNRRLTDLASELEPRKPAGKCRCCDTEEATHGRGTACWACDRYLHRNGYRCDAEIHDRRPVVRMCDCPGWCCTRGDDGTTSCPDRAADGRTFSERCKKRMQRRKEVA